MGLFFNYDNPVCNEGNTPVVFSYDPSITSLKELLFYELSQLSYYEVKLRALGKNTEKITDEIINFITLAIVNLDFRKEQFLNVIKTLYDEVQKLTQEYKECCKKQNVPFEPIIGEKLSFDKKKAQIQAVNFGEKQSLMKNTVFSKNKKMMSDIAIMLISNACLCITEIENYNFEVGSIKYKIPELLKNINYDDLSDKELKSKILNFAKINNQIMKQLHKIILDKYGPMQEIDVDLSIEQGKCILVSGHYYKNLEMLLDALKDEDINVYTHDDMLFAHSFSYFNKYKNLKGHYQRSINNLQLDFATFPGAVLITKNSYTHLDVIRGRIFTPDNNPAYGISKISENDFSPLINAAKKEKGFLKNIPINEITIGYNEDEIINKLNKIIGDFESLKYNHLFIIGTMNYNTVQSDYFNKLFELIPDNCFVISFSYNLKKKNFWHLDSFSDMSLFYKIFEEIKTHKNILKDKTTIFIPQCHLQTISHAFNMKIAGFKNVYLGECCPNVINPSLMNGLSKIFGIKKINNPKKDIKYMLKIK